jgi:membrane complex biogenesis BtpA family protein
MTLSKTNLEQFNTLFKTSKPIIGMIHLPALPGSVNHNLNLDDILSHALNDMQSLVDAKVDGILVENYHDYPFLRNNLPLHIIIPMTLLVQELVQQSPLPIGVNLLRNACDQALLLAAFTGAQFIRCNFYTGAYIADQGIFEGCASQLKRLQKELANFQTKTIPRIFADVHCKHAIPVANRSLVLDVYDAFERGLADAVIITGERTGLPTKVADLQALNQKGFAPIIIGSGLNHENATTLLPLAHGAIVGSAFKEKGQLSNPIDKSKVKDFMSIVKALRKK